MTLFRWLPRAMHVLRDELIPHTETTSYLRNLTVPRGF
jgi:hypothetical protein